MSNFNSRKKSMPLAPDTRTTSNHEGAVVHSLKPLEDLFSKVLGSFFGESTAYENRNAEDSYSQLCDLVSKVSNQDKEYVLKIAELGRRMNMTSYPLQLLSVCFHDDRFKGENFADEETGKNKLQHYTPAIVKRAKDILDILATHVSIYGFDSLALKSRSGKSIPKRNESLPMQLRKSLKYVLESYDEYKLSKGLGNNNSVSMADAIKLLRPRPSNSKMGLVYKKIIEGNLKFGGEKKQIQSELSKFGQSDKSKADENELIGSLDTSSVYAIIKNLVALHKAGVLSDKKAANAIVTKLTNPEEVRKSKMLPFRFYSAFKALAQLRSNDPNISFVLGALVTALDLSIVNLDNIEGYSAVLIDVSGSMGHSVSDKSNITAKEIALILGAIIYKKGIGDAYVFADRCERIVGVSKEYPVMALVDIFSKLNVGGCTYIDKAFNVVTQEVLKGNIGGYDNLIVLSDSDCYNSYREHNIILNGTADNILNDMIKRNIVKKCWLNNLLGNSFAIVNTDDYRKNLITGFSEKIVNMINIYNNFGTSSDIRKVIDSMLLKER